MESQSVICGGDPDFVHNNFDSRTYLHMHQIEGRDFDSLLGFRTNEII